jgi:hypothetical protein
MAPLGALTVCFTEKDNSEFTGDVGVLGGLFLLLS